MDWIEAEKRADEEMRLGRYREFNTVEELIAYLHDKPGYTLYLCAQCGSVYYPTLATDTHCFLNS